MRRKLFITALAIASVAAVASVAAAGLAGTAGSSKSTSAAAGPLAGKNITVVIYWADSFGLAFAGQTAKLVKALGGSTTLVAGKADQIVQDNGVDNAIVNKTDGMIWQPVDATAAATEVRKVLDAKIPLVTYFLRPPGVSVPLVYYAPGPGAFKMGAAAANAVTKIWKGDKPQLVDFSPPNDARCALYGKNFLAGMKSVRKDTQVVFQGGAGVDRVKTRNKMENLLQAQPELNVFTACGADGLLGGISALQSAGRGKAVNKVPKTEYIAAPELTGELQKYILDRNSSVAEAMILKPLDMAQLSVNLLVKVIKGTVPPRSNTTVVSYPGLVPSDCKSVAALYAQQYGVAKNYKPITCKK